MAWKTIDRINVTVGQEDAPKLSGATREKIESFLPRYATRQAALLPALHIAQEELGQLSYPAMVEVAEILDLHPAQVIDAVTFYTHYWTERRGRKVITVCRSITCECMGGAKLLEAIKRKLGIGEHETTPDGEYSLVTEECLALCDYAPCMIINERVHKCVKPEDVGRILDDPDNDKLEMPRSDLYDAAAPSGGKE